MPEQREPQRGKPEQEGPGGWTLAVWILGGVGVLLLVLFALLVGPWLFTRNLHELNDPERLKAQNDVRTTLVQALAGLAVAGGLIVTYRTYRQNQVEQDRTYRQRQDEQDRTYERELFTTAVEQLGHENAPVRLGALYSLESLAQDHPHRRQRVVNILCAYLRSPYTAPTDGDPDALPDATPEPPHARDPAQEVQVRQTVQRLLATHLRFSRDSKEDPQHLLPSPDAIFWPGISLDLTGATLVELDLENVSVVAATFDRATFTGRTSFSRATFTGDASFRQATFAGDARFLKATFTDASFVEATFAGEALFDEADFTRLARFYKATFTDDAWFTQTTFTGRTLFSEVTFTDDAWFGEATFTRDTRFTNATFARGASFRRVTIADEVGAWILTGATVLHPSEPLTPFSEREWPPGWIVRPEPLDPSRGTLHFVKDLGEQLPT